ncbi:hypothetical protein MNBD_NITROSPINAE03-56 [hydrothermal vent metagenome]|uniref:Uncharacterized protein n=1 Tax=hydrothermal vent metagenome TaxID=652676 RepID=A0A3B1C1H2_9ZZZZ
MKLIVLFGKAPLLEPPGSLKAKVMESIWEESAMGEDTPGQNRIIIRWNGVITRHLLGKRAAISFAAVAAALLLTFWISPGAFVDTEPEKVAGHSAPGEVVSDDAINEFVEETLNQVFRADPGVEVAYDDELMDIDTYILRQFEEIFWINGGNNA